MILQKQHQTSVLFLSHPQSKGPEFGFSETLIMVGIEGEKKVIIH